MGSPVSPLVANLFMEVFEDKALTTAPMPPKVWYRYVDDTFVLIRDDEIERFTNHINRISPHIKYTHEYETDSKLPFLDTMVHILDDASTKTTVYRKATNTDQYLNFGSNHHLAHKRSVPRTLLHRANTIVSEPEDQLKETDHIRKPCEITFTLSGCLSFPPRKVPIPQLLQGLRPIAPPSHFNISTDSQNN